jgi:hypothetical protein
MARWGGWGSNDNDDDPRGDDDVNDVRPCPPYTTINLFNKEKDRRRRESKDNDDRGGGGGVAVMTATTTTMTTATTMTERL